MPDWWLGLPPVSTTIACRGQRHRLRWAAGELVAQDHDDAEAEETLHALGGEPPDCLLLRARWEACGSDVALLTLGRRPGEERLGLSGEQVTPLVRVLEQRARRRPARRAGEGSPDAVGRRADLLALLCLPTAFIDRLVLTAFANAASRWSDEGFRSAHGLRLGAALAARATPALRRLGERLHAPVEVLCSPAGAGASSTVQAELSGAILVVKAELSPWWLPTVWGAGISEPGGAFVLCVTGGDSGGVAVEEADWEPRGSGSWRAVPRPSRLGWDSQGLLRREREGAGS